MKPEINLLDALRSLRPNVQATILDNDFDTLNYLDPIENPPTKSELEAEVKNLKKAYEQNIVDTMATKAAVLARLGITEAEARALLS